MIKHDAGATFVLVYCTSCGHWSVPATTKMRAHLIGSVHEKQVHPEQDKARDSAYWYARQHADEFAGFRGISEFATIISSWDFGQAN